ncbi:hypothetical protein ILYODFUR_019828 [Ilyodon furcidens]|uniref:Uncharacterized protein n=1 Tax=Ilyodon furcidens TaxID=33524 RepID=A0ABV0SMR4_9TELE
MGQCCFNPKWQQNPKYGWVKLNSDNDHEAQCCLCQKPFKLWTMGLMALDSRMNSTKHVACATAHQQQAPIAQFCSKQGSTLTTSNVVTASNTEATTSSVVQPVNLRAHSPTLREEVIWILKTISEPPLIYFER